MGYNHWRLVMLVLMSVTSVHGHEACYSDTWTYHNHTHSCFKVIRKNWHWPEGRDYCSQVQLGKSYGVITRLAKIDDSETNDFIITLCPDREWTCSIGLSYHSYVGDFRWDGYPTEVPKFTATPWRNKGRKYVSIFVSGWQGQSSNNLSPFVCQHAARKIGSITCQLMKAEGNSLTTTCTSQENPVKAKCQWNYKNDGGYFGHWRLVDNPNHESHTSNTGDIFYKTTCSFTVSYGNQDKFAIEMNMSPDIADTDLLGNAKASVTWRHDVAKPQQATFTVANNQVNGPYAIVVQGTSNVILTCWIQTGNPTVSSTTMSCESPITNEDTMVNSTPLFSSLLIRQARRDMDGRKCNCWGDHVAGRTEDFTSTLKVVTKPTNVACRSEFQPNSTLVVSCQTDKIYPQALCVWSYRQENEQNLHPVSANLSSPYSHDSYTDNDGFLYYKSNCSVTLTPDDVTFRLGNLTVQVTMNPDIAGIDKDTTSDAFITTQEIVKIGVQSKAPVWSSRLSTGTIVGLILASDVAVIIFTILTMITFRKLRKRNKHKTKQASGSVRVNVGFHKPEGEATDSEYVEVPENANLPGKDFRAPPKNEPERSVYEGEDPQSFDTTTYVTMGHTEDEEDKRAKKESYDILHDDDPNYVNLN